jgi:hypothetical protein
MDYAEGLKIAQRQAKRRKKLKRDSHARERDTRVIVAPDETRRDETRRERDVGPAEAEPRSRLDALVVFAHYRSLHPRSFPDPKPASAEWKAIQRRLAEGFTVADLCDAIDGCHKTPHNLGQNDRGTKYLGLDLIVRTGSQVTRFAETARSGAARIHDTANPLKGRDLRTVEPNDWTHATRPEPTKPPEHLQRGLALAGKVTP